MLHRKYISQDFKNALSIGAYMIDDSIVNIDQVVLRSLVQQALNDLMREDSLAIDRKESGAPFIVGREDLSISISHSHRWISVIVSTKYLVGVDIQIIGSKDLRKGAYYYMNDLELSGEWTSKELYLIWCAKEAMFKLKQGHVDKYKDDMNVYEISATNINASVSGDFPRTVYIEIEPTVILVFSLLES